MPVAPLTSVSSSSRVVAIDSLGHSSDRSPGRDSGQDSKLTSENGWDVDKQYRHPVFIFPANFGARRQILARYIMDRLGQAIPGKM